MSKILFFDIETSPCIGLFWRTGFKISVGHDSIVKERAIMCICWKWAGNPKVHSLEWSKKQCDKAMLKKFSKVLLEADAIVGHNGDAFDVKWINGRIMFHGLDPLGKLPTEDTLRMSRACANLNSHKLDYLGQYFGLGGKDKTSYEWWKEILLNKSEKHMALMVKYCKQDVVLLEQVYNRISPYATHRINKAILAGNDRHTACKACGKDSTIKYGTHTTTAGRYQKMKCTSCGHVFRDTRMMKEDKK